MDVTDPGYIGRVRIKNRIVMAPMISNLAQASGYTSEEHIAYLEERAKGGTGLIITEYTYVNSINSRGSRNQLGAFSMNMSPKLKRITDRVHMHDARIFMQLVHAGGKANAQINDVQNFAPSAAEYNGQVAREMTVAEIDSVTEDFVRAAKVAERSGFDGIEIHGAHGYLVEEFISPALNTRSDNYGGTFEKRMLFPQNIIDAIRSETDIAVGIRLSLLEYDKDGYPPEYGLRVAESLKNLDYVHFSAGRNAPPGSSASFYSEHVHIANMLPRKPKITTIVVGSITNRNDIDRVLEKSDFVSVGRGHLADPYFAKKVIEQRLPMRPCIRCNQNCRDLNYGEVRCAVNPDLGYELITGRHPAAMKGEVTIVGGGIKGIEAALLAARSGLTVSLYEKGERIGGQLLEITDPYKKRDFEALLSYYESALIKSGVTVNLDSNYRENGIYCLPDVRYDRVDFHDGISIDSNVYQYQDYALEFADRGHVVMSLRSLHGLDRGRSEGFAALARKKGIEFVSNEGRTFDLSLIEKDQYDIRKAIISGREKIREYIMLAGNEFL
ncbi:MAG: NAD(P)-binding protein [Candidatus Thermoplasmatota archaeon]|jgi:2,4-dienoyl-CoA reductase-like NADH-dependent reductase (Old Yellow Enzyme family)|nr:NAD(P)-binding protein [Candidatus Thermoplasmatota archaeon]